MIQLSRDEEARLIAALKRRDERAFVRFVRRYQDSVYTMAFRMLRNELEAQEAAQDVFVRVFQSIDRFRADSRLSTWVFRITHNTCLNLIRYRKRRGAGQHETFDRGPEAAPRGIEVDEHRPLGLQEQVPRPDRVLEGRDLEEVVQGAMGRLPYEQREVLVLFDLEGLSYEEIVEVTGLPIGTVRSRLHRARKAVGAVVAEFRRRDGVD